MKKIDTSSYTRDTSVAGRLLKQKGRGLFVTEDCYILVPERYVNAGLMVIDETVSLVGIYPIIDSKGRYSVSNIPTRITLTPYTVSDVLVDEQPYKMLNFNKDDAYMEDNRVVRSEALLYNIFNEFFIYGNVPWFMTYEDLSNVYALGKEYADSKIGNNPVVMELLSSVIARDPNDPNVYYRLVKDKKKTKPTYVPMLSPFYSFMNTTNKIVGAYMTEGITAALVNPYDTTETIEQILRT